MTLNTPVPIGDESDSVHLVSRAGQILVTDAAGQISRIMGPNRFPLLQAESQVRALDFNESQIVFATDSGIFRAQNERQPVAQLVLSVNYVKALCIAHQSVVFATPDGLFRVVSGEAQQVSAEQFSRLHTQNSSIAAQNNGGHTVFDVGFGQQAEQKLGGISLSSGAVLVSGQTAKDVIGGYEVVATADKTLSIFKGSELVYSREMPGAAIQMCTAFVQKKLAAYVVYLSEGFFVLEMVKTELEAVEVETQTPRTVQHQSPARFETKSAIPAADHVKTKPKIVQYKAEEEKPPTIIADEEVVVTKPVTTKVGQTTSSKIIQPLVPDEGSELLRIEGPEEVEELIEDEAPPADQPNQMIDMAQLQQQLIEKLSTQQESPPMCDGNQFIIVDGEVVTGFSTFAVKSEAIAQAEKIILKINAFGQATLQKAQDYVANFSFTSEAPRRTARAKTAIVDADISADAYCYVTQFQVEASSVTSEIDKWRATFSRLLKPLRCVIGNKETVCVVFEAKSAIVYKSGMPVFQETMPDLLNVCACGSLVVFIRQHHIQMFDSDALKIVYQCGTSLQEADYAEFTPQGIVLFGNKNNIYCLNLVGSEPENCCVTVIHNFANAETGRILTEQAAVGEKIQSQSIIRKDIDQLMPVYKKPVFATVNKGKIQMFCIEILQRSMSAAHKQLTAATFSKQSTTATMKSLFQQDIEKMSAFPTQWQPDAAAARLVSHGLLSSFAPSPPMFVVESPTDILEAELYLFRIAMNAAIIFNTDQNALLSLQIDYDKKALQLIAALQMNEAKQLSIARTLRTRTALQQAYSLFSQLGLQAAENGVTEVLNQYFNGDEEVVSDYFPVKCCTGLLTVQTENGIYYNRLDDTAYACGSALAHRKFNDLQRWARTEVETFVLEQKQRADIVKRSEKMTAKPVAEVVQKEAPVQEVKEEENIVNNPQGAKKFMNMLKGVKTTEEKKVSVKIADPTTSPVKSISIGSLLGKK